MPSSLSFGSLRAIEFRSRPEAPVVICLHGYGANMGDLAPLAVEFDLKARLRWIFPDAPLAMNAGGPIPGRAWYQIPQERLLNMEMGKEPEDLSKERPEGLEQAVEAIEGGIKSLKLPWNRIIIGGFSQGAMLAVELALRAPQNPLGLFILSGNLVDSENVAKRAPARSGLAFFQSHGRQDPILGYAGAVNLEKVLTQAGLTGSLLTFSGGHELPREVMDGFSSYLGSLL